MPYELRTQKTCKPTGTYGARYFGPPTHRISSVIEPWADAPLKDPNDDKLDRGPFVSMVTDLIDGLADSNDSTVLGLVGPWGSGKTTVLHYIARGLDSSIKVVKFNPWSFDDDAGLQSELYAAILEAFPNGSHQSIRKKATGLVRRGAPALKALPAVGAAASETLTSFLPSKSWDSEFESLATAIRQASVKILVLVDDVDRLQPKELLLLMKTVRLLGRLPRVNYLLAFDRKSTINTLRIALGTEKSAAEDYLEKIVQYPLDLPAPQQSFLQEVVFRELNPILNKNASYAASNARDRFESFYLNHMWTTLNTPRTCRRYALQAKTFFPLAGGDTDPADFFALTFMRLFFSDFYNRLPIWKEELTIAHPYRGHGEQLPRSEWLIRAAACGYSDETAHELTEMITDIFPYSVPSEFTSNSLGGMYRAYDQEYFDRYFNFSLPVGDVSDVVVKRDLANILKGKVPIGAKCADTFDHTVPDMQMLAVRKGKRHTPYEADTSRLIHFLSFGTSQESIDYHSMAGSGRLKVEWLQELIERQTQWPAEELEELVQRIKRPAAMGVALARATSSSDNAQARDRSRTPEGDSSPHPSFAKLLAARFVPLAASWLVSEWQKEEVEVLDQEILDVWQSIASLHGLNELQEQAARALRDNVLTLPILASKFVFPKRLVEDYRAHAEELIFDINKLAKSVPLELLISVDLEEPATIDSGIDQSASSHSPRIHLAIEGLVTWRAGGAKGTDQ